MSRSELAVQLAITRRLVGDELRAALGWSAFYALIVWGGAVGYAAAYHTTADRVRLQASLGHNDGLAALFGRPDTLATVGGFTAWRSEGVLVLAGSVLGLFLGARLFRGGEENGRWEYVLAGRTDRRRAAGATAAATLLVLAVLWAGTAVAALAATRARGADFGVGGALLLAVQLVGPAALLTAVAAVAAQFFPTRRRAAAAAAVAFGLMFCARLTSGVYPDQDWIRRINPLQWFDSAHALTRPEVGWLWAGYALVAIGAGLAVWLAGRRDLDGALVPEQPPRHPTPIRSVSGLGWRLTRAAGTGWLAVAAALAAMIGGLAGPVGEATERTSYFRTVMHEVGTKTSAGRAFIGLTMMPLSMLLCLCAAALVATLADDESAGRLERVLAAPVRRVAWLAGRIGQAVVWLLVSGLAVGVACWVAASGSRSLHLGLGTMLRAGLNLVPVAVLVLAIGIATYGYRPRQAAAVVYGVVASGFALELVGSLVDAPGWLLDLSVFHHLALAPAAAPRWGTNAVLLVIAAGLLALGILRLRRRDLVS